MPGYVLSPDALQDLQDIWDFIAFDNVNAADQLEDELFDAFDIAVLHGARDVPEVIRKRQMPPT